MPNTLSPDSAPRLIKLSDTQWITLDGGMSMELAYDSRGNYYYWVHARGIDIKVPLDSPYCTTLYKHYNLEL